MALDTPVGNAVPLTGRGLVARSLSLTWWIWFFPAALIAALALHNLRFLDYVHIVSAILWTGTDLFMGFVVGPVMRRLDPTSRKNVIGQLMPRMLFYMPVIAATATTAGWYLAHWVHVYDNPALHAWFVAALTLALLMFVQGLGLLLPLNLRVFWELQKERPDVEGIRQTMTRYMKLTAWQGLLQLGIVVVMVHFVI